MSRTKGQVIGWTLCAGSALLMMVGALGVQPGLVTGSIGFLMLATTRLADRDAANRTHG